jgi:hypothetical protein
MKIIKKWWDLLVLVVIRAVLVVLISMKSLVTRQRMSHQNGIVATGHLQIVDDLKIPANEFFKAGKKFDCRLRHATVRFLDDAGLIPRSASLKFANSDDKSPLDLLMNTGSASPFYSLVTFWQFMKTSIGGGRVKSIEFLKNNPRCFVNFRRAVRRDPETFAQMYYHTQTIFEFCADDGKERYTRFRLIPEDRGRETGIPTPDDLETVWFQEPKPGETRSPNYLKDEYRKRVTTRGVTYHLQMQLHEWQSGDRQDVILNSVYEWDERAHPWTDVATVKMDGILEHDSRPNAPTYSVERGDHCLFTLANRPKCIKLLKAVSIHDPASLDYLRVAGVWARRVRLFATKVFGPLKPISDERLKTDIDDEAQSTVRAYDVYAIASLPQNDESKRSRERRQEIEVARGLYQLWGDATAPRYVKAMPEAEEFTANRVHRMDWDLVGTVADLGLAAIEKLFDDDKGLEAYDDMFPLMHKPSVSERFKTDEEFGRQRLDGVNPFMIQRCTKRPDPTRFPVDGKSIANLLDDGDTLSAAIKAGRVYQLDYAELQGIKTREGCYLTAPMCLLYVNSSKKLVPIAIQLGQSPEDGPVFTPNDDFWLWQTVKTHVQSADGQYQEAVSHLLRTHLVLEAIAVSTQRQLSISHPLHKLLTPHFRFTMAINHAARTGLLAHGGPIDTVFSMGVDGGFQLMGNVWTDPSWAFSDYELQHDLESRGVDDKELLPNYHYRDDAKLLWSAIDEFIDAVIKYFYKTDKDVAEDFELQDWLREITDVEEGNIRGFPTELGNIDELVKLLTTIIFTASAGHSSTNNGQYDMYGYIPNVPGSLFAPPPVSKEPLTEQSLADILPKGKAAAEQIATAHLLSEATEDPLGCYHPFFFAGHGDVETLVQKFQKDLYSISESIKARNATIDVEYTYLDPMRIAASVDI